MKNLRYKNIDLRIIIVVVIVILSSIIGYVVYTGKMPNIRSAFTTYKPIPYDSISSPLGTSPSGLSTENDTRTPYQQSPSSANQEKDTTANKKRGLFQLNTSYDKIPNAQLKEENKNRVSRHQKESKLFSDLILVNPEDKELVEYAFIDNKVPYQSLLKLLSVAGHDILLKDDNLLSQMIIDGIGDSDQINVIHVLDRKNNIVYSSHETMANSSLLSTVKEINFETDNLEIQKQNGFTWISIPIFHTYGKVGHVIINLN